MKSLCPLCNKHAELRNSHLTPKFVIEWLKKTSVTGYLRQAVNVNLRKQDANKKYLFCGDCEQILGNYESEFARNIFHPYVNRELNDWGSQTGTISSFSYNEWLLKFIISVQFRHLLTRETDLKNKIGEQKYNLLISFISIFREYLLSLRNDTGINRSYMIFLQNLAFGQGYIPQNLNDKINYYLLRSIDSTIASSLTRLGIYTKLGPIAFFTTILPDEIKDMNNVVVKRKGIFPTAQHLKNNKLNQFIFIDRPNDVMKLLKINEKQQEIIEKTYEKNKDKLATSMIMKAVLSDKHLTDIKNNLSSDE